MPAFFSGAAGEPRTVDFTFYSYRVVHKELEGFGNPSGTSNAFFRGYLTVERHPNPAGKETD